MDAKILYKDVVHLAFNLFRVEKTRVMLLLDAAYEEKFLLVMNDILLLEKDYEADYINEKWFAHMGKTFTNILQKKVKFEKPDNKKLDDVYKDYSDLLLYVTANFEIERKLVENSDFIPNENDLKLYEKVNDNLINQYKPKEKPKVEVIDDNSKVKSKDKTGNSDNFSNQRSGPNFGGFGGFGNQMENPFTNDRFYPFKTKLKHSSSIRRVVAVSLIVANVFVILNFILSTLPVFKVNVLKALKDAGFLDENVKYLSGIDDKSTVNLGIAQTFLSFGFISNLIMLLICTGFIVYSAINTFKPIKTYRDYYSVNKSVIIYSVVAIVILALLGSNYNTYSVLTYKNSQITDAFVKWVTEQLKDPDGKNLPTIDWSHIKDLMNSGMYSNEYITKLTIFKIDSIITIAVVFISAIYIIVILFLNPKLDRQKLMQLQREIELKMSYAMQGQNYEIDNSLFVPENEYNDVINKINSKYSKSKDN